MSNCFWGTAVALASLLPTFAYAGVCESVWDGDKIINALSDSPSYLRIPLKDKNQSTTEITVGQLKAFHDAKERIARVAGLSPAFIICGDSDPNAFASSGSRGEVVGVTVGMLRLADGDPDIAAAVISHEYAHHIKGHREATKNREAVIGLLGLIAGVALEYNIQKKSGVQGLGSDIAQIGASLTSSKFSRDQEREADTVGFQYLVNAGFNPNGAIRLSDRFNRMGHGGGGWFFDTHPGWDERGGLFRTMITNSPEAQKIVARGDLSRPFSDNAGDKGGSTVAFAPAYQMSDAEKTFQVALAAYRQSDYTKAFEECRKAAVGGYAPAQSVLGYFYENGQGTESSISEAINWYRRAAEQGVPHAQLQLGRLYETGTGVSQSYAESLAYYKKAADRGDPIGLVALGKLYERGLGVAKDSAKAFELYKSSADKGASIGIYFLGLAYSQGIGVEKDLTRSIELLLKAAEQGNGGALVTVGMRQMQGIDGFPKNQEEAIKSFRKAAENNNLVAFHQLGMAYESGSGVSKDSATAKGYYAKAARGKFKDAEIALARLTNQEENILLEDRSKVSTNDIQLCEQLASFEDVLEKGIRKSYFGFIDVEKALTPCVAAYKKNPKNTRVQTQLARIYFQQGKFQEGIELARSAMKEQRAALVTLAYANRLGVGGLPVNLPEAVRLLEQAAGKGDPEGMSELAAAYRHGYGVAKDERRTLDLLRRASDIGDFGANVSLALAYASGAMGLGKSLDEAIRILQKPADSGAYPPAAFVLGMSIGQRERRMTPEAWNYLSTAREKFERLSEQGSASARAGLGLVYSKGIGVKKDAVKAFELFRMAASHNHVSAIEQVGLAYLEGIGTTKNEIEGRQWLERASVMGSETADKKLKLLAGN